ncbi:hypothetical protein ACFVR6_03380 [Microbacterium sp. NPDC058021]|uniref:hypothetical protein n=1 Tax=Microbacterium sp. NPDC058021 TaxID=3346306 RepID=UPI0036DE0706
MQPKDIAAVVQQPPDWWSSIFVPVAAILVSAGIAVWLASRERKAGRRDARNTQAIRLIRALNDIGRHAFESDEDRVEGAHSRYEQELNAFAAHLSKRELVVAKFVCEVVMMDDESSPHRTYRTMLWLATSIELWIRGTLSTRQFEDNLPRNGSNWVDSIELGQWDALVRGEPITGMADLETATSK